MTAVLPSHRRALTIAIRSRVLSRILFSRQRQGLEAHRNKSPLSTAGLRSMEHLVCRQPSRSCSLVLALHSISKHQAMMVALANIDVRYQAQIRVSRVRGRGPRMVLKDNGHATCGRSVLCVSTIGNAPHQLLARFDYALMYEIPSVSKPAPLSFWILFFSSSWASSGVGSAHSQSTISFDRELYQSCSIVTWLESANSMTLRMSQMAIYVAICCCRCLHDWRCD